MDLELVLCHIPVLHAFELFLGTGITKQTVIIYPPATELAVRLLLCLKIKPPILFIFFSDSCI